MRWLAVLMMVLSSLTMGAEDQQTPSNFTFKLPKPHQWDKKSTLKCKALASVSLKQVDLLDKRDTVVAEANPGTDTLELTLKGNVLLLRGKDGTDRYKVVGNTKGFLSAVFIGELIPVVNSIVVGKESGLVVWSIAEPMDLFTSVPYAQAIYLTCQ